MALFIISLGVGMAIKTEHSLVVIASIALGSLVAYATDPATTGYQPMHVNFGLVPPLENPPRNKAQRRAALAERARADLGAYVASRPDLFAGARG